MSRPSWDEYFMLIAEATSLRSTCSRARVGAVIVRENRIISGGYNGAPPGQPHCQEVGCTMEDGHCQSSIHAEVNAVVHSQQNLRGADIYIWKDNTGSQGSGPCRECTKVLRAAGINTVHTRPWRERDERRDYDYIPTGRWISRSARASGDDKTIKGDRR